MQYKIILYQKFQADSLFIVSFFNKRGGDNEKIFIANAKCVYIDLLYKYFVHRSLSLTDDEKNFFKTFIPFLNSIEALKATTTYYRMALDAVVKANANIGVNMSFTVKQFKDIFLTANQLFSTSMLKVFTLTQFTTITNWYNTTYLPLATTIKDSLLYGTYSIDTTDQQALLMRYNNFKNAYTNMLPYKNTLFINYSGQKISLSQLLNTNKPIVINFWATWCGPCIAEMPMLDSLQHILKDKITLYTISIDKNKQAWHNFLQQRPSMQTYSYCVDTMENNAFLQQYQIAKVPRFMVLLSNGDILASNFQNTANDPNFVNSLDELLIRMKVYHANLNANDD
ncbi:MAG: redoxin domain-containing protein [Sphingobacteriales bacterium]|uniref:TlpA family protein disulfide reductase n=1 Tax=Hydrotalea flava TaxID=714549 RepID=UPI00082A7B56|nr:TlpA disulfide reductase family protein [Hydrotalea flava]RTL54385.1 MAG: redoxin domain-containing protein [Sphingobacteriales bacterium]